MKTTQPLNSQGQLTDGSIGLHLLKLSVPMLFNIFMVVSFNLTDTYFIAQLGTDHLAAMSFTFPVVATLGSLISGLGSGATAAIALAIGEGNRYSVQRLTTDSMTLSVLISLVSTVIALSTLKPLFTALGAGPDILPLTLQYMQIWYLGLIFLVVPAMAMNAIRAVGNVRVLGSIMMAATLLNIGLNPCLIFGWLGLPRLELRGAALATVISQAITLILALAFLHRKQMILFTVPKLKQAVKSWQAILRIGIPLALTTTIKPVAMGLITSMVALYGSRAIAGFGIALRIESVALIAFMALSTSVGPVVGQNWGAGKFKRVKQAFNLSLRFCLIWGGGMAVVLGLAAPRMAAIFDANPEVVSIVAAYMAIVPISYAAAGIIEISSSTFVALGRPLPSVTMTLVNTLILYVPLAKLCSHFWGIRGIFVAACIANIVVALGALVWNRRTWQERQFSA